MVNMHWNIVTATVVNSIDFLFASFIPDRTVMLPFVNQQPFCPQTSLEKIPRTAPPLTEIPAP
jgi:hypothetical protein